jgi:hypothetical protein
MLTVNSLEKRRGKPMNGTDYTGCTCSQYHAKNRANLWILKIYYRTGGVYGSCGRVPLARNAYMTRQDLTARGAFNSGTTAEEVSEYWY